ncbi:MAG: hypothetical protein ACQKBT_06715, partial [Puniceicoccales bacterium]
TTPPDGFRPPAMVLLEPNQSGLWGERVPSTSEENLVTDWEEENDLLRHVNLDQVIFPHFPRYSPPPSAEVYAWSFEDPVIFGDWHEEPRWLTTAFGLDESDLVYRTVFPIFMGNILRSLSLSTETDSAPLPGESESLLQADSNRLSIPENKTAPPPGSSWLPSLSLRNWLLLFALLWTLLEWRLFHRKITE